MSRFVIANRRARKFTDPEKKTSREALDKAFLTFAPNVNVVHDNQPHDLALRRVVVFDADPVEMAAKKQTLPTDVLLEPEILHWPDKVYPRDLARMRRVAAAERALVGFGVDLPVEVKGAGQPLEHATTVLVLQAWGGIRRVLEGETDKNGHVTFSYGWFYRPVALIVIPYASYWSVVVRGPRDPVAVNCPPLPASGPLAWWHEIMGIKDFDLQRGDGIRVGVVDSGVGPHPNLSHVGSIGAFIDGDFDPQGGADVDSHGSHVCGIIGARPSASAEYGGMAPGATLCSARVFPPGQGANQGDIANAIDEVSKIQHADLINMSLGSSEPSQIILDAIQDALERGTLCVCAAGNEGKAVGYPAAFEQTLAVSALGLLGWAPDGTLSATRIPEEEAKFGDEGLFLANFSCFGPEVSCAAGGVGIISTVPERHGLGKPYAAMDGTSMASPAACGALAVMLSKDDDYKQLPRDQTRAEMARTILRRHCRDIGLSGDYQGRGVPDVG